MTRSACLAVILWLLAAHPAHSQSGLRAIVYASGLSLPVAIVQDPTNAAVQFVVEQGGRIRAIQAGQVLPTDFLDLRSARSAPAASAGCSAWRSRPTTRRAAGSSSTSPTRAATRSSHASRDPPTRSSPTAASRFDLQFGGTPVHRPAVREPQRRPPGVRPRRLPVHRAGRRRLRKRPRSIARRTRPSCSARCCGSTSTSANGDPNGYRVPPDNPFPSGRPPGAPAGNLVVRPAESMAVLVRRCLARRYRRAHHRRRRAERVRRNRLRATRPRRPQLRLAQSRRGPQQRHGPTAGVLAVDRSDLRVPTDPGTVRHGRVRVSRHGPRPGVCRDAIFSLISSRAASGPSRCRSRGNGEATASGLIEHTAELGGTAAARQRQQLRRRFRGRAVRAELFCRPGAAHRQSAIPPPAPTGLRIIR